MSTCKLCLNDASPDSGYLDLCFVCATTLKIDVEIIMKNIHEFQEKANNSTSPDERIKYLTFVLNSMYDYKVKYYDNLVDILDQDIYDGILEIIDAISYARE